MLSKMNTILLVRLLIISIQFYSKCSGDSVVLENGCTKELKKDQNQCSVYLISVHGTEKEDCAAFTNETLHCKTIKMVRKFDVDINGLVMHLKNTTLSVISTANGTIFEWSVAPKSSPEMGSASLNAESIWDSNNEIDSESSKEPKLLEEWKCTCTKR